MAIFCGYKCQINIGLGGFNYFSFKTIWVLSTSR